MPAKLFLLFLCVFSIAGCSSEVRKDTSSSGSTIQTMPIVPANTSSSEMNKANETLHEEDVNDSVKTDQKKYLTADEVRSAFPKIFAGLEQGTSIFWHSESQQAAFLKRDVNDPKKLEVVVFSPETKETKILDSIMTERTLKTQDLYAEPYFHIEDFSPSGVYLHYSLLGAESCEGKMMNIETGKLLEWSLEGCPKVVWSPDRKEAMFGIGGGFYGPGKFLKSIRGNISQTKNILQDIAFEKRIEEELSLKDYRYEIREGQEKIIFTVSDGEGKETQYSVSSDGNDLKKE